MTDVSTDDDDDLFQSKESQFSGIDVNKLF